MQNESSEPLLPKVQGPGSCVMRENTSLGWRSGRAQVEASQAVWEHQQASKQVQQLRIVL